MAQSKKRKPSGDEPVGFFRRLGYLFGPIAATALLWLLLGFAASEHFADDALIAGVASLLGLGTTVIFAPAILDDFMFITAKVDLTTWELAMVVIWINAASGFWYIYNLDLLHKLPKIGPALRRSRREAVATVRKRPWIRRLATIGVGFFVITPLPGSGCLGGAIIGRIVGISKRAAFWAVAIAGLVVSIAYAILADKLKASLDAENIPWWQRVLGLLLALFIFWLIWKLMRKISSKYANGDNGVNAGAELVGDAQATVPPRADDMTPEWNAPPPAK